MCGISALFKHTRITETDIEHLHQMNKEMKYRGPDEEGVWHDDVCGLAQTRLSIIGLNNGHQPIFNEDKTLVLICNGEIYNYKELIAKLRANNHTFRTESDSEVILHLYEDYGKDCLLYLRGMFAFCLYDTKKKIVFAARDRIGEKTLYYAQIPCGIVLSTELKAIVKYHIEKPLVNTHLLAESIRFGYPIELKHTYIDQVCRLMPGEYAFVDCNGIEIHQYWNRYCLPKFDGSPEEAKNNILALMRESVANCLQSDVPVAVLLSGGIDSSAIAHFAKETGKEIHCICAGYKGNFNCDEREVARKFAKGENIIYHEVELDINDFKNLFEKFPKYIDEPVADQASIAQWAIYEKAKEMGFTVLLGGLGGDELFYGYEIQNRCGDALRLRYELDKTHSRLKWLKTILANPRFFDPHRRMRIDDRWPVDWTYEPYLNFIKSAVVMLNGNEYRLSDYDVNFTYPYKSDVDTVYDLQFSRFMTTQCLYLADRLGMGNSVELRSPFVDYKLVEFVSSLPIEMKYTQWKPKHFLKELLDGIIPSEILYGKKRGFTPPSSFIQQMCEQSQYKLLKSQYKYFNSLIADKVLSNVIMKKNI